MNLQEKINKSEKYLDESLVKEFNKIINKLFLRKHNWFKHIDVSKISYDVTKNYFAPTGRIFVDSEWGAKQWREYHYSTPIPASDEELSFGDIIGGEESQDLQNDFKLIFSFLTGEKTMKYMSFSWLEVYFIETPEKDGQNLQEIIRRILKEEFSVPQLKLIKHINNVGFLETSSLVGGIRKLLNILGKEYLTPENMISIIKELILNHDNEYITLSEMSESPIIIKVGKGELSQIEMLEPNRVVIFHYGGHEYEDDLGETTKDYDRLSKELLNMIFNMVLDYYEDK